MSEMTWLRDNNTTCGSKNMSDINLDANQIREVVRKSAWVAFVWNDHNFMTTPEQELKALFNSVGVNNLDDANKMLENL